MPDSSHYPSLAGASIVFAPPMAADHHNRGIDPIIHHNAQPVQGVIIDEPFDCDSYGKPVFVKGPGPR